MAGFSFSNLLFDWFGIGQDNTIKYLTFKVVSGDKGGDISLYKQRKGDSLAEYDAIFKSLFLKYKTFPTQIFKDKDEYFVHIKVPSEKIDNLFFDVVLQFTPEKDKSSDSKIDYHRLRIFSNAPSFLFTYAYVCNKQHLLITQLRNLVGTRALNEPPVVRNKAGTYGFEKTIYFATQYMLAKDLNKIENLDVNVLAAAPFPTLLNRIPSCSQKLEEYNAAKKNKTRYNKPVRETNKSTSFFPFW